METKHFKQGEIIFKELTLGNTMYEIKNGTVGIFLSYGAADEKKLTELGEGRIFGELSVIEVYPRSATAVALTDVETEEISTADLQEYFNSRPEKLLDIMRGVSRRLRELTTDYQEVCAAIAEWKQTDDSGKEKSKGLMAAIKKFAELFAESAQYMPIAGNGLYYFRY